MPTATETAAPKAATKPKTPKKPTEAAGEKEPAKKSEEGTVEKQPTKKRTTSGGEKKPATAAGEKKPSTPAGEKKQTTSGSEKKRTTSGSEKKRTTSGSEKKRTTSGSEKKRTTSGGDKKRRTSGGDKKRKNSESESKKQTTDKNKVVAPKKSEEWADEPAPVPVYVPKLPVTLPVLNTLELASCAKVLENLLNFTPSLGAALANLRPFKSAQQLVDQLNLALDGLPLTYIESFLKRFDELPLIAKAKLSKEHKCCVGLDKLTEEQKSELTPLYSQYREKFGFPFVVCAREAKASELAVMVRSHQLNDKDQELEHARKEIKKIARLRLLEVVAA